jgi:ribosomal-protein-alanine N-acetyltransferase
MPSSDITAGAVRPPEEGVRLRPMRVSDLDQILSIEQQSFASPWKREHFLHELEQNRWALNLVADRGRELIGYACLWLIDDELKINNIAVHPATRRCGYGRWFLLSILDLAIERGCRTATLEVRPSNIAALKLYRKHGFEETGRRRNYYAAEGEDAILMSARLSRRRWKAIASGTSAGV